MLHMYVNDPYKDKRLVDDVNSNTMYSLPPAIAICFLGDVIGRKEGKFYDIPS